MKPCKDCPVCHRQPHFYPSMRREAESVECPWDEECPKDESFDFSSGYLPIDEAIDAWNKAVEEFEICRPNP